MRDDFKDTSTSANAEANLNRKASAIIAEKDTNLSIFDDIMELAMTNEDFKNFNIVEVVGMGVMTKNQVNILVSAPGEGKTNLALGICNLSLSDGNIERVIYIDKDNSPGGMKNRVEILMTKYHGRFLYMHESKIDDVTMTNTIKRLEQNDLTDTLIVFDSLVNFSGNTSEEKHIKPFMEQTKRLRNQNATILVLHHTRKSKDEDGKSLFTGSQVIRSQVDSMIYVSKLSDENNELICRCKWDKERAVIEERELVFKINKIDMTLEKLDRELYKKQENENKDSYAINAVKAVLRLNNNEMAKTDLRKELHAYSKENHPYPFSWKKIDSIINNRNYEKKHWFIVTEDKNKQIFKLIENPYLEGNNDL